MAEGQESKNASFEMQKEMRETDSEKTPKPATDETNNACASSNQASGKSQNLEDLLRTLHQQITTSDWLEKNTADQWVGDNPDIAQEFLDAAKKS